MALGDVIQIEPIVREIYKMHNGNCFIDISTRYPNVFDNHPCIRKAGIINPTSFLSYQKIINLNWAYELDPKIHIQDAYANVALDKINDIDGSIHLYSTSTDMQIVDDFFGKHNILENSVILHMRSANNKDGRNLPESLWESIINNLLETTDANIIQVGSDHDMVFEGDNRLINALGQFSIQQLGLLIGKSTVFLGGDSGPMHVAYSTTTPIVGLFTTVLGKLREPRNRNAAFEVIYPQVDCYGCKEKLPVPNIEFVCAKGTLECVDKFNLAQICDTTRKYLKVN